jgi:hypothetical protein
LRILLAPYKFNYVLETALGDQPLADDPADKKNFYQTRLDDSSFMHSGMLYAMEAELRKHYENMSAYEMISSLKDAFAPQARAERYEASELFFSAKMEEHNSVSKHVVKMSGYVQRLNNLECTISNELATDRVLQSLPLALKDLS